MTYIIVFLAVIALFYWKSKVFEKIDREEKEALSKDGHATFIRTHYPNIVEDIQKLTGWSIGKERDDAVFINKSDAEYIGLLQHSGRLNVVYVANKKLVQEWKYNVGTSNESILKDVAYYVEDNSKSNQHSQQKQDIGTQVWQQFGKATDKHVVTTNHLLLLQQFVTNALFVYYHPANKTKTPSFLWKKELYLGDNSMVGYSIPFVWFKCMSQNDTNTFNKSMDILNKEYAKDLDIGIGISEKLMNIKKNGFVEFIPNFDLKSNNRNVETLWRDSECLKSFITFFGTAINLSNLLPGAAEVSVSEGSEELKELVKKIASDFREGNISLK